MIPIPRSTFATELAQTVYIACAMTPRERLQDYLVADVLDMLRQRGWSVVDMRDAVEVTP